MTPVQVLKLLEKWKYDEYGWNYFSRDYLHVKLDNEQDEALYAIRHNSKTAIASGTSRGKDYLIADAAICFMYLTPEWNGQGKFVGNTKVILSGPTNRQVKEIMMPEISRIFREANYLPGELTSTRISTKYEEWFLTAFKADNTNIEAWTGFHAVNIFFGITEATGMHELIFPAIEGNLQGNSRLVLVLNPNINHGYAASAFKSPQWKKIYLNSLNAPNVIAKKIIHPGQVDWQWVNDRVELWCTKIDPSEMNDLEADFMWEGSCFRPNDLFRIKVLGRFPKVSEGVLVPGEWIEAANRRWKEMQQGNIMTPQGVSGTPASVAMATKALRLGFDVAGMGRDSSSFCHRFGNYVDKFEKIHGAGEAVHMEVVGKALSRMKEKTIGISGQTAQAFIDTIGEGAGSYSRMVELGDTFEPWLKGRVHSCKFSEGAEWNERPLKDITGQYEFLNMRAYSYWAIRDWLNPANKNDAALPEDPELYQELTETQWKFMSNGKIQLESKEDIRKRIKRSPDKGDALANTFWPVPDVDPNPQKKQNLGRYFF